MIFPVKSQSLRSRKSVFLFLRQLRTKPTCHNPNDQRITCQNGKFDFRLHKSKGQHLLTNPRILDKIVRVSNINPTDTVLEIGPGTGNLTIRLLEAASKVVAVEIDKRMVEVLSKRAQEHQLEDRLSVICEDALKADYPRFDLVVANIPYGISSPLVTKLVYGVNPFRCATLLLQKEFARRLLAEPGDSEYNRLAANVKLVANVEYVMDVSKRDFLPSPKVDSSVVLIRHKAEIPDVNLVEWRALMRTCFNNKNKTLGATFRQKRKVMELLRLSKLRDFRTECAVKSDNYDYAGGSDDEDEVSDEEDGDSQSCSEVELNSFKEKIIQVLVDNSFEDKRPSKLSIDQLLNLLSLLNHAGVFFSRPEQN